MKLTTDRWAVQGIPQMLDEIASSPSAARASARIALALLVAVAVAACSATAPGKTGATAPDSARTDLCALADPGSGEDGAGDSDGDDRPALTAEQARVEIRALDQSIADSRRDMRLPVEPGQDMADRMASKSVAEARAICEPRDTPSLTCKDMCKLSRSICDNAARICDLAEKLDGDTWARDRCTAATTSCAESSDRCCQCSL